MSDEMQFDHVGVVVPKIAQGQTVLRDVLGVNEWTEEFVDPVNRVYVRFGRGSTGPCYELIAPLGPDSYIARALATGSGILNHVAYLVGDLDAAAARLRKQRCMPIGQPNPAVAYGGRRIQFFVTPMRFITELIEAPDHRHAFAPAWRQTRA